MTNKQLPIVLLVLFLLLASLFAWQYYSTKDGFDWSEQNQETAYEHTGKEPYDLFVFSKLLKGYFPQKQFSKIEKDLTKELKIVEGRPANYVFVGEAMGHDSTELEQLLDFVEAGNTAFISTKTIVGELQALLYSEECDEFEWKDYETEYLPDSFFLHLYPSENFPPFPFFYSKQNNSDYYKIHYIPTDVFYCESEDTYQSLGYLNEEEKINFAVFQFGAGRFLLHSTPIAFTNFHLLRPEAKAYTKEVLNYLADGPIYFDTHGHITEDEGRRRNFQRGFNDKLPKDTPLATLLTNPSLAWAWYLSLATGLAYVLFRGKRRQRTIPILPKNSNTSIEFIDTIAHLHFKDKNYQGIGIQKMRLFLAYLRERFAVSLHSDPENYRVLPSKELMEQLSKAAEVPYEKVETIFSQYAAIVDYSPTDEMLIDFYRAIEEFRLLAK